MENEVTYFKGAKWATLSGSFTVEELRKIAKEIIKKSKKFEEGQNGNKK